MIIPLLAILLAVALVAGNGDSSSDSSEATAVASEVGKTKPKIEFTPGSDPSRLEETDLVVGDGPEATPGTEVTVHYIIVLNKNGKEVDSSWGSEPYSFELGSDQVTAGWEQGIEGMKEGGRRELIAPAELAYGKAGSKPAIGPNEDLLYVIDLVKVKEPAPAPGPGPSS
jgi:peptidylprolyl isomerase